MLRGDWTITSVRQEEGPRPISYFRISDRKTSLPNCRRHLVAQHACDGTTLQMALFITPNGSAHPFMVSGGGYHRGRQSQRLDTTCIPLTRSQIIINVLEALVKSVTWFTSEVVHEPGVDRAKP